MPHKLSARLVSVRVCVYVCVCVRVAFCLHSQLKHGVRVGFCLYSTGTNECKIIEETNRKTRRLLHVCTLQWRTSSRRMERLLRDACRKERNERNTNAVPRATGLILKLESKINTHKHNDQISFIVHFFRASGGQAR